MFVDLLWEVGGGGRFEMLKRLNFHEKRIDLSYQGTASCLFQFP